MKAKAVHILAELRVLKKAKKAAYAFLSVVRSACQSALGGEK